MLADRAQKQPDDIAYTFIDYEVDLAGYAESLTWAEVHHRARVVAQKLATCGSPGDRAVILAPQSLEYIIAFLGAIQAGFVAVPLSVPQFGQHDERVSGALGDSTPAAILTTSAVVDDVRKYAQAQPRQRAPRVVEIDALDFDSPISDAALVPISKPAYLQYTSGSTRQPAGVMVTHQNILTNIEQLQPDYFERSGGISPQDMTIVSWLPLYHDMGLLVGLFLGMAFGHPAVLMSPVAFMQKPARWMQQLAMNSSTFTAAPNFAYDLAVRRTSDDDLAGMDLGGVQVMI
ncbi:MAG TPA: AMP-binding protein, partial [Mycobacterium sp.]|nr:AMP-binding protein [Mycobacterium sp.]